jgi:hypothetical protein
VSSRLSFSTERCTGSRRDARRPQDSAPHPGPSHSARSGWCVAQGIGLGGGISEFASRVFQELVIQHLVIDDVGAPRRNQMRQLDKCAEHGRGLIGRGDVDGIRDDHSLGHTGVVPALSPV